jgi:hypothetical protein
MKRDEKRERDRVRQALCSMFLLMLILVVPGCVPYEEPINYEAILSRVQEGDERQQALGAP